MKVRINATGDTIVMKFVLPNADTKLEGYILGYGSSMFSKQFIELPEDGKAFETEFGKNGQSVICVYVCLCVLMYILMRNRLECVCEISFNFLIYDWPRRNMSVRLDDWLPPVCFIPMFHSDAEPKYLIAVQPVPTNEVKKKCTGSTFYTWWFVKGLWHEIMTEPF